MASECSLSTLVEINPGLRPNVLCNFIPYMLLRAGSIAELNVFCIRTVVVIHEFLNVHSLVDVAQFGDTESIPTIICVLQSLPDRRLRAMPGAMVMVSRKSFSTLLL